MSTSKERVGTDIVQALNVTKTLALAGTQVTATAADLNLVAGMAAANTNAGIKRVAKVALRPSTPAAACSPAEPRVRRVLVNRVTLDVTTKATAACTVDVGTTSVSGTTSNDGLMDGLDVGTAAGTFDNIQNPGTNVKPLQKVAAGKWVTGSRASGASASIVGFAYIEYALIYPMALLVTDLKAGSPAAASATLTKAGLDGSAASSAWLEPLAASARELGLTLASPLTVGDADLAVVTQAQVSQLVDVAELRSLENALGNLTKVSQKGVARRTGVGRTAGGAGEAIARKAAYVRDRYGVGRATIQAGTVRLEYQEPPCPWDGWACG